MQLVQRIAFGWVLLANIFSSVAYAAGPEKIAFFDRSVWPQSISDKTSFNKASRFEIYQFTATLVAFDSTDLEKVAHFTGINNANGESIARWRGLTEQRLVAAYRASCAGQHALPECTDIKSTTDIVQKLQPSYQALDATYNDWKRLSAGFHQRYLYEQLRLAALFPRITSEILTFNDQELTGFELPDGEFLFTFDDGPSQNNATEQIIATLNDEGIRALFFQLGERLSDHGRENIKTLYSGHCVGSHGYSHDAHPKLENWPQSIDQTQQLLSQTFDASSTGIPFRPPYGQRNQAMLRYLNDNLGSQNVLWNIDSQDWNRSITANDEASRVITLMLLWRKGIVLFHDLYPKNNDVIHQLSTFAAQSGVAIIGCEQVASLVSP